MQWLAYTFLRSLRWLALPVLLVLLAWPTLAVHAAGTIDVTTTDDEFETDADTCSLREAIESANTDTNINGCTRTGSAPYTINLPAGIYAIARSGIDENANETGDFDILEPMSIQGAGAGETIIQGGPFAGGGIDRVFHVQVFTLNTLVTFTGVTVRYGKLTTDNQLGGGIFDEGFSNLTINDSVITQNRLEGDGSVGAGIFDEQGSLDISGSQITSNEMTGLPGTSLLGIAGIAKESGTMTMINSEVSGNQSPNASIGGLLNRETTLPTVVRNSTIANNFTGMAVGGAAFFGPTLIVNSTISGNTANANFGGVVGLDLNLVNVTITNNIADADNDGIGDGGGLGWESPAVIRVQNSIIAGNFDTPDNAGPGDIFPDVEGEFISQGHNLIGSDAGLGPGGTPFTDGVNGDMVGTSSEPLDALLSDLGDNGGATPTHLLLEGSPAIDAGDPTACADATLTSNEDQRGIARPINGDGEGAAVCDIGAVEVPFEGRVYLPLIAR